MMKINDNVALCLLPAASRSQLLPIVSTRGWSLPQRMPWASRRGHQLPADTLQCGWHSIAQCCTYLYL